jgi:hypothetical protein
MATLKTPRLVVMRMKVTQPIVTVGVIITLALLAAPLMVEA